MAEGAGSPPVLLRPMLRITDRIRTATRLGVVVLALLVPGALATGMYTAVNSSKINFSTREREGSEVLRPVLVALTDTAAGRTPDLAAVRAAADAHPDLEVSETAAAVPEVGGNSLPERIATATALAKLVTEVSNESNLALDPDLDSFYVMHAQAVQLPVAMLTTLQTEMPVPAGSARLTAVANQAVLAGRLASSATVFRNDVATATANTEDTELAGQITGPVEALADRLDELAKQLTATLAEPGPADTGKAAEAATAAVVPLNDALNGLIDERISTYKIQGAVVLAISIGGFGLALWCAVAVLWRTNHDVRQTVDAVTAIAAADLSPRPLPEGRDEMGDIGRALIVARTRLADQEAALFTAEAAREQQLRAGFQHQRQAEKQFRRRTQEIIDESTGVIAEELRQVTEKVGEVKGSSEVIDNRISVANQAAGAIVDEAREAEQVIASLEQSLRRAASMVNLVNGIAGQTRLLALNATIEAARAGDLGYGFTVVADEVKQLATNTAESTDQITQTIHDLERDTTAMSQTITAMIEGIGGVGDAATSLREVAAEQATLMGNLTAQMNATLGRVEEMANLASHLERREHDRIATAGQVTLRPAGRPAVEALLVNVSAGGLRCIAPAGQQFIEGVAFDVDLRRGDDELTAQARVVNMAEHENGQEVGLQFLVSDDGQARRLAAFADRLMEAVNVG
ncbi:methyl-accepting chemotaxis protein [Actinoplanes lobatus]|uniref:Methyl-accepting chemotaxis protein n=1 Tax=Actinoplanes lobatus TaxID=113568 RepID=A0A7W7HII1_9ACTN|nr:methyl-accepting chemotaxis protein [Actinoplanes lobatus]MBB4751178.1 methyl-accepting chemotaxis protein [Actinoplanes lobatus]GGN95666.1 methyl-accepting chemotaxis protein [Actinoplanes lobatus]GIE44287.1 methyl-accepting chemotaxis protein [Actinoplanes lobatus]